MAAYLIGNITVTDPGRYAIYRAQVPDVVAQYSGRFLVRAGAVHPLEGDIGFDRFVVIEFASLEAARRFYESPEYAPLLKLRMKTAGSQVASRAMSRCDLHHINPERNLLTPRSEWRWTSRQKWRFLEQDRTCHRDLP